MELNQLKSVIESLLFVSGEPLSVSKISRIAGVSQAEVENALMMLAAEAEGQKRGVVILRKGAEAQMATNSDNAAFVEKLIKGQRQESLSSAALEVLAIVAYRGPMTKAEIEEIRGVNSSYTLRNLLLRGLVERKENPRHARGYLYEITFDFLRHLGVNETRKLPDYESLSKDGRLQAIADEPVFKTEEKA